jgi:hypothetical protein
MLRMTLCAALAFAGCSQETDGDQAPCPNGCAPGLICVAGECVQDPNCEGDDCPEPPAQTISDLYPGDVNIADDPRVVFSEDFESATFAAWTQIKNEQNIAVVSDHPAVSAGQNSVSFNGDPSSPSIATMLPENYELLYIRYYLDLVATSPRLSTVRGARGSRESTRTGVISLESDSSHTSRTSTSMHIGTTCRGDRYRVMAIGTVGPFSKIWTSQSTSISGSASSTW